MAIMHLFKSRIPSCKYVFTNGKEAHFVGGKFMTDVESEIAELKREVALRHPHVYIDDKEEKVDTDKLDPLAEIKKKAVEEYLAAQKKAVNPTNDMGKTEQGKLQGIVNSQTNSELAADSVTTVGSLGSATPVEGTGVQMPASLSERLSAIKTPSK